MSHSLSEAQGIKAMMNTRTSSSALTPSLTPFPTPTVETLTPLIEVDLVDVMENL